MPAGAASPPARLRVLDTGPGEPAFNMALDDALLHGGGPATLRLYGWSPAGLSLGWFQPAAPFAAVPGTHHIVRRRTGGGAIYHGDEITFALALDAGLLPADIAASYALVHGAVQRALTGVGVATRLLPGAGGCHRQARPAQPWCFAVPGPNDIVLAGSGRKIVGSAQRRLRQPRARVLHHGSIVLRAPGATPFCGAVADVVPPARVEGELRARLVRELASALALAPAPAPETPTAAELRHAHASLATFTALDAATVARRPGSA